MGAEKGGLQPRFCTVLGERSVYARRVPCIAHGLGPLTVFFGWFSQKDRRRYQCGLGRT